MNQKLKDFNEKLSVKKVAIIGLGVSNIPLLDYLKNLNSEVAIFDNRTKEKLPIDILNKIEEYNFQYFGGENSLENLKGFDIIFRSPSCLPTKPELEREIKNGAIVTTEIEMFMELFPGKVIGITGSDGKTTTTSLIYAILKENGINTYLGGNIGIPLFTKLEEMNKDDVAVLELSSFQLMGMKKSPDISVITNITPNHLNIHKDYAEYIDAKKNVFKFQDKNGIVVLNYDNEITKEAAKQANGKVIFFSSKEKLANGIVLGEKYITQIENNDESIILNTEELKLKGRHMYEDVCAAIAATKDIVSVKNSVTTIKDFGGVEHRLEFVRNLDGVKWYNDSIASSPTRTIAGLNSFEEPITLIAGGYDKNLDFKPLAKPVLDKVKNLILIGTTSKKILDVIKEEEKIENKEINIYLCESFEEVVLKAKEVTLSGEVVLLSPACASFDMFKNFEERGKVFKEIVNKL